MEEVTYHVNLNYELFLSGSNKKIKGASWFDHIFFFINKNSKAILRSDYPFSDEYLNHLEKLDVSSIKIAKNGKSSPWWGPCNDLEKERFFNSKITMTDLGLDENWIPIPSTTSVNIAKEILHYPIISRDEWGVSGRGIKILKSVEDFDLITKRSVYSEFVNKFNDYGITFDLENETYFIIENYIDSFGQFKGGEVKSVSESIGEENLSRMFDIRNKLIKLGAKGSIQIDTFTYDGGFHPFVEVNYRKTMGLMIHNLLNKFDSNYVYWGILNIKNKKSFSEVLHILDKFNTEVVLLSPVDKFISVALLSDESLNGREKLKELEIFISKF